MAKDLISQERLHPALDALLRKTNVWWDGGLIFNVPPYQRWIFSGLLKKLKAGLTPAVILRGPRQIGKTTLQDQIINHLIEQESFDPKRIFRVQFDDIPSFHGLMDPILTLCRWYEDRILGMSFYDAARQGAPAYIFFDEVQNQPYWAPQVKALVDHFPVKVLITGSSALRIKVGQDSLAGRVTTVDLGPLLLREIASLRYGASIPCPLEANGLAQLKEQEFWIELRNMGQDVRELRDRSFTAFSERGAYPIAQARADASWDEIGKSLNENVVQRAIVHDLRLGQKGSKRDPRLLEHVFRMTCRYAGQTPGLATLINEARDMTQTDVTAQRINNYLHFLDDAMLIKLIEPTEIRLRSRKKPDKICLCDLGVRAAWLNEQIPLDPGTLAKKPHLADLAGHLAESVLGYFLSHVASIGLNYFPGRDKKPEREPEVDFVLTIGLQRIPIELKYQSQITGHDLMGLRSFLDTPAYEAKFGILVTRSDRVEVDDPRVIAMPLSSMLLMR